MNNKTRFLLLSYSSMAGTLVYSAAIPQKSISIYAVGFAFLVAASTAFMVAFAMTDE